MGRVHIPFELSAGRPSGPRWSDFRRHLVAKWFRAGRTCYYCAHPFAAPQLIEVAHLISPLVWPAGAWLPDNLAPSHGRTARGGNRRCPECDLNCNWLAHNSPDAPKDPETGADLPFTAAFITRQTALRAEFKRQSQRNSAGKSPEVPRAAAIRRQPSIPFRPAPTGDLGRDW